MTNVVCYAGRSFLSLNWAQVSLLLNTLSSSEKSLTCIRTSIALSIQQADLGHTMSYADVPGKMLDVEAKELRITPYCCSSNSPQCKR